MVFDVKRSQANVGVIHHEEDIVQVEFKLINSVELDSTLTSHTHVCLMSLGRIFNEQWVPFSVFLPDVSTSLFEMQNFHWTIQGMAV